MNKHVSLRVLALISILFFSVPLYAQEKSVTVDLINGSLKDVFTTIEKQTTYRFSYRDAVIDTTKNITITGTVPVTDLLDEAFKNRDLEYKIVSSRSIVISDKRKDTTSTGIQKLITGVIRDENGEEVIGATIVERGTTNGAISDMDGKFQMEVGENSQLQISYIGYADITISTTDRTIFNITLQEDSQMLDEVVVIGYGTMKKRDLTGAITHVQAGKLAKERPATLQDILRSSAPGLNVEMTNNAKGGGNLLVRGQRSLRADIHPLIVLNGMIFQGDYSEINPADIESVDILKDASSAAVYGAKSANGVVLITTKKGKEDKPTIRFDGSVGFVTMGANRRVYDPEEYLDYRADYAASSNGFENAGYYRKPTAANLSRYNLTEQQWRSYDPVGQGSDNLEDIWLQRLGLGDIERTNYFAGRTYDWYDASFHTGIRQDYNISLSGKSSKLSYYWSLGYLDSEGVVVGDRFKAYRSSLNLDAQVTDFLEAGVNLNMQSRKEGFQTVNWERQIANSPYSTPYNEDGTLNPWPMGETRQVRGENSLYNNSMSSRDEGTETVIANFYMKVKLPFNISYQFSYAPRYSWNHKRTWSSAQSVFDTENGVVTRDNAKSVDWTLDNMIKWDYTFAGKHTFDVTLLQSAEQYEIWTEHMAASDFTPSDVLQWHSVSTAANKEISTNDTKHTGDALMARLFYSFDNRYMVTASVRRDGFSAFGKSNPRASFPALALAWNFTNEQFFNWEPMSNGKLRFSWGKNGNRDIGIYQALSQLYGGTAGKYTYATQGGALYELSSLQIERMSNHDLKWESTSSWNIGADMGFLNNRINGSFEWYYMPTTDLLMDRTLPNFTGYSAIITNLGKVVNEGFELSINTLNIDNRNFSWSSVFGLSHNKNRIKHLYYRYEDIVDDNGSIIGSREIDDENRGWFIDRSISTIWDYEYIGIWQEHEAEEAALYGQSPGDAKARDVNEDYSITQEDKVFLGQKEPKFRWSFRNEFTLFKDWDISFNIYSQMGHKQSTTEYLNFFDNLGDYSNTYKRGYWTPENQSDTYARLKSTRPSNINPGKVLNKSFIRLENISVSYKLPRKICKYIKSSDIRVYGTIRNVAVWAIDKEWDYWDPETGSVLPRTYTLGASITF